MIQRAGKVGPAPGFAVLLMLGAGVLGAQNPSPAKMPSGTPHAPDEFGTQDYTVTTLSAASFTPASNFPDNGVYTEIDPATLSTRFGLFSVDLGEIYASVNIPSGAVIDYIGLQSICPDAFDLGVALDSVDVTGTKTFLTGFSCTAHAGFATDYNPTALGLQLARNVHNAVILNVETTPANTYFGWVEIWWRRVVSPAPAVQTFNDVPTGDPGFQYIEALAASGITGGCGGGNYCPDSPLTRRQMAVFLSKALGLHWPY
jgi:hypothetical protein